MGPLPVLPALLAAAALAAAPPSVPEAPDPARLQRSCDRGKMEDCAELAELYQGHAGAPGLQPDLPRALRLLERACAGGHGESCYEAGELILDEEELAREKPRAGELLWRGCTLGETYSCQVLVDGGAAEARPDLAEKALARVQKACDGGDGGECWTLARWAARGTPPLVPRDLGRAKAFAHQGCAAGLKAACDTETGLSLAPPSPAEEDDIREAALRALFPREEFRRPPYYSPWVCVAFGTDADPLGTDPPPAFLQRFADLDWVKPRSWCVQERKGDRLSVGPVQFGVQLQAERTVRLFVVRLGEHGGWVSQVTGFKQQGGKWVTDHSQRGAGPEVPAPDHSDDERRLHAVVGRFAEAWNRRDFEALAALWKPGEPGQYGTETADSLRKRLQPGMDDTRIDPAQALVQLDDPAQGHQEGGASVTLVLEGTWTRQPGGLAPLDPWKQPGARSPLHLLLHKASSWWEPGDWVVSWVAPPWSAGPY